MMRIAGALLLVGAGVVIVAAVAAAPTIARIARPAAREGLRRGLDAYERARTVAASIGEDVEDWVAALGESRGAR